jgi:RNA polymerase sigma-70 factor (ECF subfamily)
MAREQLTSNDMLESAEDFGSAYETYAEPIYKFFYWRTQNRALSEDLTSSVFEKAWRSRGSFKTGSARAWLYRIARNLLIDHWRLRKDVALDDQDSLASEAESISTIFDKQLLAERAHQALAKLPPTMRVVINLRFIEGMSSKKVARITGHSESNVRVIQYRALKRLRKHLNEQ